MKTPKSRDNGLVVQEIGNEVLIYDLNNHKAYCLNETSAIIWKLCDGKTSIGQMSRDLAEQLNDTVSEEMLWLALDDFKQNNLLADNENFRIELNGLSRRQIIRKVGFASMIALPIVSSLVAPTSAHAQSGRFALNAACTSNNQCQSGNCRSGTNAPRCCAAGTTDNLAPNTPIGCDSGCTSATTSVCCSNSVKVGPDLAFCTGLGFPSGSSCYCN